MLVHAGLGCDAPDRFGKCIGQFPRIFRWDDHPSKATAVLANHPNADLYIAAFLVDIVQADRAGKVLLRYALWRRARNRVLVFDQHRYPLKKVVAFEKKKRLSNWKTGWKIVRSYRSAQATSFRSAALAEMAKRGGGLFSQLPL